MKEIPVARRRLGQTSLYLSEVGLGGAGIGNLYGAVSDEEAADTIEVAWQAGIRYIDTAPYYGFGLSERRVGDGARKHFMGNESWVVSTKVGRRLRPCRTPPDPATRDGFANPLPFEPFFDYSYDGILRSFEDSLQRTGLSRIDILLVHDIGSVTHGDRHESVATTFWQGGYRALDQLRSEGCVAAIGLGVNEWQVCEEFMERGDFDCFLLAGRYTLLEQDALSTFLPKCAAKDVGVILGGIYNSGILATGLPVTSPAYYNYAPAPPEILQRVQQLEHICNAHGVSLAAAALQFVLAHPQVSSVIPGAASAEQLTDSIGRYREPIPFTFWADLKSEDLIHPDAPVPIAGREPDS